MLPWPKSMLDAFKAAEANYNEQVNAMATIKNLGDYALSLFIMAFLPALFEEVLFRVPPKICSPAGSNIRYGPLWWYRWCSVGCTVLIWVS